MPRRIDTAPSHFTRRVSTRLISGGAIGMGNAIIAGRHARNSNSNCAPVCSLRQVDNNVELARIGAGFLCGVNRERSADVEIDIAGKERDPPAINQIGLEIR